MHGYRLQTDAVMGVLPMLRRVALMYAHLDASLTLSVSRLPIHVRSGVGFMVETSKWPAHTDRFKPLGREWTVLLLHSVLSILLATKDATFVHMLHIPTVECML